MQGIGRGPGDALLAPACGKPCNALGIDHGPNDGLLPPAFEGVRTGAGPQVLTPVRAGGSSPVAAPFRPLSDLSFAPWNNPEAHPRSKTDSNRDCHSSTYCKRLKVVPISCSLDSAALHLS